MAEVVLEKAGKTYPGGVRAVEGFDLRIADGEFVVLVGPSGCGKSTTLRMIAGLEEITEGSISIAGAVVNDVHARDRDIAMVFQNYALYPHMTVERNLSFGLMRRRVHRSRLRALLSSDYRTAMREESMSIDRRVSEAARMLGITELLARQPRALSGGQRQRVALGRALVRAPQVFLFDEPLSNLDAKLRVEMRTELRRWHPDKFRARFESGRLPLPPQQRAAAIARAEAIARALNERVEALRGRLGSLSNSNSGGGGSTACR